MADGNPPMDGDEIVLFPVPKRYLKVVILAVAEAMMNESTTNETGAYQTAAKSESEVRTHVAMPPRSEQWTEENIRRLKRESLNDASRALLDLVAERPHDLVPFPDVIARAGVSYDQTRGQLGAFTKLLKRRFGTERWPVDVEWGPNGTAFYRVASDDVAQWWREA